MKTFIAIMALLLSQFNYATSERNISPDLVEDQRKYTTKVIFDMIKHAKINHKDCNIKIGMDGTFFGVDEGSSSYVYGNTVEVGRMRQVSDYDCVLSKKKDKLKCFRELPHNSPRQKGLTFSRMTINLDEKGYAISMHGNEITEYSIFGKRIPMLDSVNSKFSCDIQIPAKLKDPAIVNNGREESNFKDEDDGSLSSDIPSQISGKSTEK